MKDIMTKGLRNFRDIGGVNSSEGYTVRKGMIYRSDALCNLSDEDFENLQNKCHISLVVDLRTDVERGERPDVETDRWEYIHLPLFHESVIGVTYESGLMGIMDNIPDIAEIYERMLSDPSCILQLKRIIEEIINYEGVVVYHCTAGKDRTGIVTMLLYGLLGVSEEDIIKDYLLTNRAFSAYVDVVYNTMLKMTGDEIKADKMRRSCIADEAYLKNALEYIYQNNGSIKDYCIQTLGIADTEIKRFRDRMLQEGNVEV